MILFFDACSKYGMIALYTPERNIVDQESFCVAWNESSQIIALIHNFLQKNTISYSDVRDIICVNGPGSFTGVRTITLVVNTLAYIYPNISLTPVNFFDLPVGFPQIKESSKRDLFVKYKKWYIIQVVNNEIFEADFSWEYIYGDVDVSRFQKSYILENTMNYVEICKTLELQKYKKIAPVYIKKPNIT